MLAGKPIPHNEDELLQTIARLEDDLKAAPDNVFLLVNLAGCHRTLAQLQAEIIEAGIQGKGGFAIWHQEHLYRARQMCKEAVTLNPNFVYPRALLAHLYVGDGDYDLAEAEYLKIISMNVEDSGVSLVVYLEIMADCRNNLALIYLRKALGQVTAAFNAQNRYQNTYHTSVSSESFMTKLLEVEKMVPLSVNLYGFDHQGNVTYPE